MVHDTHEGRYITPGTCGAIASNDDTVFASGSSYCCPSRDIVSIEQSRNAVSTPTKVVKRKGFCHSRFSRIGRRSRYG